MALFIPSKPEDIIANTNYSTWLTAINSIRTKQGYSGYTTTAPTVNTTAQSSQMQTIQQYLNSTRTLPRIAKVYTANTTLSSIGTNQQILASTVQTLSDTVDKYYSVCAVDSVCSTCTCTGTDGVMASTCFTDDTSCRIA